MEQHAEYSSVGYECIEPDMSAEITATDAAESTAAESKEAAGGKLVMATNAEFPPYEFHDGDKIVGIDAEI